MDVFRSFANGKQCIKYQLLKFLLKITLLQFGSQQNGIIKFSFAISKYTLSGSGYINFLLNHRYYFYLKFDYSLANYNYEISNRFSSSFSYPTSIIIFKHSL